MPLKRAEYKDERGIWRVVMLPEGITVANPAQGVPVGPPDLSELGLSEELEVRLSNELFHRGILTANDATTKRSEVMSAITSALKLDVERIITQYAGKDYRNASKESTKEQPDPPLRYRRPRRSR